MAVRVLHDPPAQQRRCLIYKGDQGQDDQQYGRRLPEIVKANGCDQLEAYSACSDHSKHGRRAHTHFEPVEIVGQDLRQNLREHGEDNGLDVASARGAQRLQRLGIDVFDRFRIKSTEDPAEIDPQCKGAGKWPQTDGGDKEYCPDQLVDAAQPVEDAQRSQAREAQAVQVAGGQETQRQAEHRGNHGSPERDADGVESRPP